MVKPRDEAREPDRVRRNTAAETLWRIDAQIEENVRYFSRQAPETIDARIDELRREWSIERYLQINVCTVGLLTAALAFTVDRKWGIVTAAGLSFFLVHAQQGFDPPLPILRRMGLRTRREIDRELYALKALRGDFDDIAEPADESPPDDLRVRAALRAVGLA